MKLAESLSRLRQGRGKGGGRGGDVSDRATLVGAVYGAVAPGFGTEI